MIWFVSLLNLIIAAAILIASRPASHIIDVVKPFRD
jgi:hypothetical protein